MQNPNNEIVSAASFEIFLFKGIEAEYPMHGTAVRDNESGLRGFQGIEMAGEFTAVEDGSTALVSLRALTSGSPMSFQPIRCF